MSSIKEDFNISDLLGKAVEKVGDSVDASIEAKQKEIIKNLEDKAKQLCKSLDTARTLEIKFDGKTAKVEGLKHKMLDTVLPLVATGQNVMLVGSAGTGKTKGVEQVAQALSLPFYCMSVGAQTSKSDLIGFMSATGKYVKTAFRDAYEKGGVFCMDEIDAGNSNVLIVLNSALSNGQCSFPDGMVKMSDKFRFVATANTYGNGASRSYVGRNQIDGATLDRFTVVPWDIDEDLERQLVAPYKYGEAWLNVVKAVRQQVREFALRAIVSPRATLKGAQMLDAGLSYDNAIEFVFMPQMPEDYKDKIRRVAKQESTTQERERKRKEKEKKEKQKQEKHSQEVQGVLDSLFEGEAKPELTVEF